MASEGQPCKTWVPELVQSKKKQGNKNATLIIKQNDESGRRCTESSAENSLFSNKKFRLGAGMPVSSFYKWCSVV